MPPLDDADTSIGPLDDAYISSGQLNDADISNGPLDIAPEQTFHPRRRDFPVLH